MSQLSISRLVKCLVPMAMMLMSACAHLPPPTYNKVLPAVRQTQLTALQAWNIDGAFSLQGTGQSVVANYQWLQQAGHYELKIASTLNLYSVVIAGNDKNVSLWRATKLLGSAPRPESLMEQQLGWQLPVSNLHYWIRSLPAPGPYHAEFDAWGHLISLKQQGWQIEYADYVAVGPNDLPTTIRLYSPSWKVKIIVKHWAFP